MNILKINQTFCSPDSFQDRCVDILCGNPGVFNASCKSILIDIYNDMRKNINCDQYKIYDNAKGCHIHNKINISSISKNGNIYAGHDLPVWLNNPEEADWRVMVISQDPRRDDEEMGNGKYEIGISSPFGLHSQKWRSNKTKGFVHWLFLELFRDYEKMSVYYTDIYKLRGVGSNSTLDDTNINIYKKILLQEIELFNPNIVLLMGDKAQKAYKDVMTNVTTTIKPVKVETPHPNARVRKDDKHWGKYKMQKFDIKSKIEKIKEEFSEIINNTNR